MDITPVFEIGVGDDGMGKAFRQVKDFSGPFKLDSKVIFEGPEGYITLQLLLKNEFIRKKKAVFRVQLGSKVMSKTMSISKGTRVYSFFFPVPEKGRHRLTLSLLSLEGGFYFHKKGLASVEVSEDGMSIR